MGCLYKIEFPNGKEYVGISSTTAAQRFKGHCAGKNGQLVVRALRKYGKNNVNVKTLVVANDWKYLCLLEQRAIKAYATKTPHGYNMTDGGEGTLGCIPSEESRRKMSLKVISEEQKRAVAAASKGNKHALGYRHTAEARAKIAAAGIGCRISEDGRARISAARKGKPLSAEHCAKLSASHVGKVSGNKGVKWSEETRAKHAARHAARKVKP
jgi:group I intron endonuclease